MKLLLNPTQLQCQLTIGNWAPCTGIQKLIGFGRGLGFHRVDYFPYWHHDNSIRLGYNRDTDTSPIRLFMYAYVDGKRIIKEMGLYEVGTEIIIELNWKYADMSIYYGNGLHKYETIFGLGVGIPNKTSKFGFLLGNYAEIDGPENKRTPFEVDIKDLKVNGKNVKIK